MKKFISLNDLINPSTGKKFIIKIINKTLS